MGVWSSFDAPAGVVEPDGSVLAEAVESELAVDVAELSAVQLGERSLRLRVEHDRLAVAIARTDAEFESTRGFRQLGSYRTAAQWLADQRRIPAKAARRAYARARRLVLFPAIQAAVVAGTVTFWHAVTLGRAASDPGRVRQLREDVGALLGAASGTAREFGDALRVWCEDHFAAQVEAGAAEATDARAASTGQADSGAVTVTARLHPVWGAAFSECLGRIEAELFDADWAAAKAVHGDQVRFEHLARGAAQRRADAMVEMAMRAEASVSGAAARRPLVSILVGHSGARDRLCELEDGTHITRDQAIAALRVSDFERVLFAPDDRVSVSKRARLFTGAERRAVEVRDRECTQGGCDVPGGRCDVDHIDRYEHGGLTDQANGRLACPNDHQGRRADPQTRPRLWEYAEDDWDDLETDRALVRARPVAA